MPSEWVTKRNRAKYLSGYEWAIIIDALSDYSNKSHNMIPRLLAKELADRGLADN